MPLLLIPFLMMMGCDSNADIDPEAILGTGSWMWEDLNEGDSLPVIQGPQGGFHLLGSVRLRGVGAGDYTNVSDATNPTTTFEVLWNGENLTPDSEFTQGIRPAPKHAKPWTHEMVGRFAILDIEADDELDGVDVEFSVTVTDVNGLSATDSLMVKTYADELNQ